MVTPVGVILTKNYPDAPFWEADQPKISVYVMYSKNQTVRSWDTPTLSDDDYLRNDLVGSFTYSQIGLDAVYNATTDPTSPSASDTFATVTNQAFRNCVTAESDATADSCAPISPGDAYSGKYETLVKQEGNAQTFVWPSKILAMIDTPICAATNSSVTCQQTLGKTESTSSGDTSEAGSSYTAGFSMDLAVKVEGDGITGGLGAQTEATSSSETGHMAAASHGISYVVEQKESPNVVLQGFSATVLPCTVVLSLGDTDFKKGEKIYATTARHYGLFECDIDDANCSTKYFELKQIYEDVIGHKYRATNPNGSSQAAWLEERIESYRHPPATFKTYEDDRADAPIINIYNIGANISPGAGGYTLDVSETQGTESSNTDSSTTSVEGYFGAILGVDVAGLGMTFSTELTLRVDGSMGDTDEKGWTTNFTSAFQGSTQLKADGANAFGSDSESIALATTLYTHTYDLSALSDESDSSDSKGPFCVDVVPTWEKGATKKVRLCEKQTFIISSPFLCVDGTDGGYNAPECGD